MKTWNWSGYFSGNHARVWQEVFRKRVIREIDEKESNARPLKSFEDDALF